MNNKQPFSNLEHIMLELLLTLFVFFLLLFSTTQSKLLANHSAFINSEGLELKMELSKTILSGDSYIDVTYYVINNTSETFEELNLKSGFHRFQESMLIELDVFPINAPVKNIQVAPGDTIGFHSEIFVPFVDAGAWIVNAGIEVKTAGQTIYSGAAKMIYGFGVNMDINAGDECIGLNELRTVELISRLLIDEDAAKDPGVTVINVGGMDIIITLPETQWEARNIMLSCSELNSNVEFDPFDLPSGVELDILCDQENNDLGRNTENVLDECEPIETFRNLCNGMGEDDVLCEFPEWVFCFDFRIAESYLEDTYTIDATDDYEVWQALENPAGSGNFDPFVDVTNDISSGNSDQVVLSVKTVLPVNLIGSNIELRDRDVVLSWQTTDEINNSHFEIYKSNNAYDFVLQSEVMAKSISGSINSYSIVDDSPYSGDNYYKLVQKDLNGQTSHLVTKYIHLSSDQETFNVYPIPVFDQIFIESKDQYTDFEIYDLNRRIVLKGGIKEDNIFVDHLESGIYILQVINNKKTKTLTKRIVVSK
jgi:hypothetical protein